jgi:hypothetical protein
VAYPGGHRKVPAVFVFAKNRELTQSASSTAPRLHEAADELGCVSENRSFGFEFFGGNHFGWPHPAGKSVQQTSVTQAIEKRVVGSRHKTGPVGTRCACD